MSKDQEFYSCQDVRKFYSLKEEIGRGMFSVVRKGVSKETGKVFAVKIINKSNQYVKRSHMDTEISILQKVDHPNVVHLEAMFETKTHLFLVMEFINGGELFDRIAEGGPLTEKVATIVSRQILLGIQYLHSVGVVHRDLKPENILVIGGKNADNSDLTCKITDFGLSKIVEKGSSLSTACGTPNYVAPEVLLAEGYDKAVDLWAIGVIVYILLSGCWPFDADAAPQLYELILSGTYTFPPAEWKYISEEAKDLIRKLLVVDPKKRYTVEKALEHIWLKQSESVGQAIPGLNDRVNKFSSNLHATKKNPAAQPAQQKSANAGEEIYQMPVSERGIDDVWEDSRDAPLFIPIAKVKQFKANEPVILEGKVNKCFYRVKSGSFRVEKSKPDGGKIPLITLGPNEMFGEISMLHPSSIASADVVAAENAELYVFSPANINTLFKKERKLCERFYKLIAIRQSQRLGESIRNMEKYVTNEQKKKGQIQKTDSMDSSKFYKTYGMNAAEQQLFKILPCKWKKGKMPHHGPIYITTNYICFSSQVFSFVTKHVLAISKLEELSKKDDKNELSFVLKKKKYTFQFATREQCEEGFDILNKLRVKQDGNPTREEVPDISTEGMVDGSLTTQDWEMLLEQAEVLHFESGQAIVAEGEAHRKLYQVFKGKCRVEQTRPEDDKVLVLGSIGRTDIFGDISFLLGRTATASVIADEPVDVYVISGDRVDVLCESDPSLAGRFYKHLAIVNSKRLSKRETDIIGE